VCNTLGNFTTNTSFSSGESTGSFTFTVTPSVTGGGGAGVGTSGSDSADVFIQFKYVPLSSTGTVPEPASLPLIAGLIGLGVFARRKRWS
jgi:PEP-CTERM motif-containing protein